MFTIDRVVNLLSAYGLPGEFAVTHDVLDKLDKAAKLSTRDRYVGARVALHEKFLKITAPDRAPPEPSWYFWLGKDGEFHKELARGGAGRVTCRVNRTMEDTLLQETFFSYTGPLGKVKERLYGTPLGASAYPLWD